MSAETDSMLHPKTTHYSLRGAVAFGLTTIIIFAFAGWFASVTGTPRGLYILAAGPACGIAGGLAFGRRIWLPVVLGITLGCVGAMFMLQEVHSPLLLDVVLTGLVSAFLFWLVGACATLALPSRLRFDGAKAFAIPGGIAGMAFQLMYGPAYSFLELGRRPSWTNSNWELLALWLTAGVGGGWLFGAELDRIQRPDRSTGFMVKTSRWAVVSVALGSLGLIIGAVYFFQYRLPFGLMGSLSPSWTAADWLWSWSILAAVCGIMALFETVRRTPSRNGKRWAMTGVVLSMVLFSAAICVVNLPLKTRFDSRYAHQLLEDGEHSGSPQSGYAVYTGNLILAQAALDNGDVPGAREYLLAAASTSGFQRIQENGPDTTVARSLLERGGQREAVLEYLERFRTLWPRGTSALDRWAAAIRAGRMPNFNNRN